jgi:hypothetical protein
MILFPLLFFPWAKTLRLALDHLERGDSQRKARAARSLPVSCLPPPASCLLAPLCPR